MNPDLWSSSSSTLDPTKAQDLKAGTTLEATLDFDFRGETDLFQRLFEPWARTERVRVYSAFPHDSTLMHLRSSYLGRVLCPAHSKDS